jgi:glycosyltransferase involved in cell wall biosynthesis/GT2 family glycosyltransferase
VHRYWTSVIEPLLEATSGRTIVEVGAYRGQLTERLVEFAQRSGAVVHSIDPAPAFDVDAWLERHGEHLVFHRARSLNVLDRLKGVDVALVDGDHNWFTVRNELLLLERRALEDGAVPPVVALHDVDWPYGRRDLYYDPESIPAGRRQPYARRGMLPDQGELVEKGGLNEHLFNAIYDHGVENGVQTAIESFTAESKLEWSFRAVHGFHGLGVLFPAARLEGSSRLRRFHDHLRSADFLDDHLLNVERGRIDSEIERALAGRKLAATRAALDKLSQEHSQLATRLDDREAGFHSAQAEIVRLEGDLLVLRERFDAVETAASEADARHVREMEKRVAALRRAEAAAAEQAAQVAGHEAEARRLAEDLNERETALAERTRTSIEAQQAAHELESRLAAARGELGAGHRASEEQRQLIQRLRSDLGEARGSLEKLRSSYDDLRTAAAGSAATAEQLETDLQARDAELVEVGEKLARAEQRLALRAQELQGAAVIIRRAEQRAENETTAHEARVSELLEEAGREKRRLEQLLDQRTARLAEQDSCITMLTHTLDETSEKARTAERSAERERANRHLAELAVLQNRGAQIAAEEAAEQQRGELQALQAQLAKREERVAKLTDLVTERDEHIRGLKRRESSGRKQADQLRETGELAQEQLESLRAQVDKLIRSLGERDDRLARLRRSEEERRSRAREALEQERAELRLDVSRALGSRSWRYGHRLARMMSLGRSGSAGSLDAAASRLDRPSPAGELLSDTAPPMPRAAESGPAPDRPPIDPSRMKIGFVEPHLGAVGGIRRVLETSNRLVARGHEVTIFLPEHQPLECNWMECRATLSHLDDGRLQELDFAVFNHEPQWYLLDRFVNARYRVFLALSYSKAYEKSGSWESLRCPVDLRLANSAWTADRIEREVGQPPLVVPTGIDTELFRPIDVPKEYEVLCVGDRRAWKGTPLIERACEQLGIVPEKFAGKELPQAHLAEEYSKAEIFVVGSPIDGFGFPGLEALACGVPLVTTDNGGCREYARHEETALVVPPGDPDAMADAIRRLRADVELRRRLVENGLRLVAERFSWDDAADGFERALAELAQRDPPPISRGGHPTPLRSPEPNPVMSVIVLSYNTIELLQRCVESIRQCTDVPYELIVVDNGSTDGSEEYVAAAADHPIANGYNAGFSGGFNQGLRVARGEFVFFLNSDTKLPPGWASRLVESGRSHPSAGIVFPAVTAAGNMVTVRTAPADRVVLIPPFMEPPSGVALAMRRDVATELGGWSELYEVASGEDTDLCFTVWVNGLTTILDEAVVIDHVAKASAKQLPDQKVRWAVNRSRFLEKWTGDLADVPRLERCPTEVFEANKHVARGVAFWMQRYFGQRDQKLLAGTEAKPPGATLHAPAALVEALQPVTADGAPANGKVTVVAEEEIGPNGRGTPRARHLTARVAWRIVRPLVPDGARERYYRRHRERYERVFPDRAVDE